MAAVYWITGLSGAGKTTVGRMFYGKLKAESPGTVFLDGDELRRVFGDDLGYTKEDRRKCAMRYARLCAMLQGQGLNVVCCTISMFEGVREWNRENIPDYTEVYIEAPPDVLKRRNQKGLYHGVEKGTAENVVGMDMEAELPEKPDVVLINDGTRSPEELCKELEMKIRETGYK